MGMAPLFSLRYRLQNQQRESTPIKILLAAWRYCPPAIYIGLTAFVVASFPLYVVAILLASIAAFFMLLQSPWLIWPMIGAVLPLTSSLSLGPISLTDLLLAVAVGLWFLNGVRLNRLRITIDLVVILFGLYLLCLTVLLPRSADLGEALPEVVKWAEIIVVYVLIRDMVPANRLMWVVVALLLGGTWQAMMGIVQFAFQIGPSHFVLMDRFMRASGTFSQPNPYAGYLGALLPVAVSMAVVSCFDHRHSGSKRPQIGPLRVLKPLGLTAIVLVIGLGVLASWSRGSWMGTTIGIGLVLLMHGFRNKLFLAGAILVLGLVFGMVYPVSIPASIQDRIAASGRYLNADIDRMLDEAVTDENFAVIERVAHWKAALLIWQSAPWLGVGPGGYAASYAETWSRDPRLLRWDDPLGHAHNIYLNVLAESGLIGLVAFLTMWAGLFIVVSLRAVDSSIAVGVLGVLTYLSIHSLFDNLFVQGIYLLLGYWMAILKTD